MKNKKALPILLFSALTLCLTLTFALPNSSKNKQGAGQQGQEVGTYPASKQDLVSDSGEKILEITGATYQTTENSLDSSSVTVKNLSGKNITAIGMVWTVSFTDGGRCQIEQLVDYRIHKDIVAAKGTRPFAPYEEKFIPRLTKESLNEGQKIKSVKVEFSFVEFDDSDGVGVEKSEMHKQLLAQREGAEIYKHWVEAGYGNNPQSMDEVVRKLSGDEMPNDKLLENARVKQGALIYKQWMLDTLKDKGLDTLRERLQTHRKLLGQR